MLKLGRHGKMAEDQHEDKDIVNAQAFFDQIPGEKFVPGISAEEMKDPNPEKQRQDKVAEAEQERLPNPNFLVPAMKDAEIDCQQQEDKQVEAHPHND